MDWKIALISLAVSYLIGSFSFSRLIAHIINPNEKLEPMEIPVEGTDLKYTVSSTGATAASMKYGSKAGCLIGFLDIIKVSIPVLILRILYPDALYILIAALAGMAGHIWPVFYKFKGGRGMASYYGGLFVIDWLGAVVTCITGMLFGFLVVKDYFVAYMAGLWLLIPWMWIRTGRIEFVIYAVIANVLYIAAMIPDFKQMAKFKKVIKIDTKMVLETNPMGRGMLKIAEWLKKIFKKSDKGG